MNKNYTVLFLLLIVGLPVFASQPIANKIIPFGNGNELVIYTKTGLFSIKNKGEVILNQAKGAYILNHKTYESKDYQERKIAQFSVNDNFGEGQSYILTSKGKGLPEMQQHFTFYKGKSYLVFQLIVRGKALKSNYLAPLITNNAKVKDAKSTKTLFVPFDNDTFIRYDAPALSSKEMTSSGVGAIYDGENRNGWVLGALNHTVWKSAVRSAGAVNHISKLELWAGHSDVNITRDSIPHGYLTGNKIESPKMYIGYFSDWREGMEQFASACKIADGQYAKKWDKATPIGWNSWGVIQERLTYEKAVGVANYFDKEIPKFRNEDHTAFIDLDSFWDNMVSGGFSGDFSKLKEFVAHCKARNLEPGVYWAPFTDWGFKGRKNRKAEGSDYTFDEMWTKTGKGYHDLDGGRALDPTHPGTKARVNYVINKLKECGFKMIKIDFLGHAVAESVQFYNPTITTGMQAYRVGMEDLTNALDNKMLIYAAISPNIATGRYAHIRRIACDAWSSIENTEYTLNSVTYGWWQKNLYDYLDADHLVFRNEPVGANRARLISGLVTGPVILGDDFSVKADWQKQVNEWLQNDNLKEVVKSGKVFTPVEGNVGNAASRFFVRKENETTYIAVFNYDKKDKELAIKVEQLGLSPNKKYKAIELLGNETIHFEHIFSKKINSESAYIYRLETE
ncbi:alpha-galactosidase [Pedobacter sp. SL55]|uniref:alpha-galactosidase n=1 Tax=Pedobacter sp. SL55 TaxID=2995161 RepID=UPI00226F7DA2|nr:alpha-galactosidase [Pedobacter sp. SL55]WAC39797.1 alpha-galactosidase [Pedobacter sp. SL55]